MLTEDISTQSYAGARHIKVKFNEKYIVCLFDLKKLARFKFEENKSLNAVMDNKN